MHATLSPGFWGRPSYEKPLLCYMVVKTNCSCFQGSYKALEKRSEFLLDTFFLWSLEGSSYPSSLSRWSGSPAAGEEGIHRLQSWGLLQNHVLSSFLQVHLEEPSGKWSEVCDRSLWLSSIVVHLNHRVSMEGRSGRAHGRQGHVLVFPTSSGGSWALLVDACREAKPVQDTYNLHQLSPRCNCLLHWQNQDPHGSQLPTQNFFLYRSPSRAHVHLVAVLHLSDGWV